MYVMCAVWVLCCLQGVLCVYFSVECCVTGVFVCVSVCVCVCAYFVGVHMPFQYSPKKSSEAGLQSPHLIIIMDLVQVAER